MVKKYYSRLASVFGRNADATINLLSALSIAVLVIYAFYVNAIALPLQVALGGWSPLDWVGHVFTPNNFATDFPSGVHVYERSLFLYVYIFAYELFGGISDVTMIFVLGMEMLLLTIATIFFCRSMPFNISPSVIFCVVAISVASGIGILDFSRIGKNVFYALYYATADAARIMAIAFVLRKRLYAAAICLAMASTTHPIMGGLGLVFIIGLLITKLNIFSSRDLVYSGAIFFGIFLLWNFCLPMVDYSGGGVPKDTWIAMTRIFNSHWYTYDLGLLTSRAGQCMIPLLAFSALFYYYLPLVCKDDGWKNGMAIGYGLLIVLTAIGIVISLVSHEPFAIKLNLQRASMMAVTAALPVLLTGLVNDFKNGNVAVSIGASVLLIAGFFSSVVFPIAAAFLVISPVVLRRDSPTKFEIAALIGLFCLALMTAYFMWQFDGFLEFNEIYLLADKSVWIYAVIATSLVFAFRFTVKFFDRDFIVVALVLTCSIIWIGDDFRDKSGNAPRAGAYRAVQEWARENTPVSSLFFVDPMIFYGWRDYSQRSSFGNLREWLHTSWLYDSNKDRYKEGMRRFGEFGLPVEKYLALPPESAAGVLYADFDRKHYAMSDEWRRNLAKKYGISYFVLDKAKTNASRLKVAFENDKYIVFDVTSLAAGH